MARELAILTFQTLNGVMQAPSMPDEDPSGDFANGGWAAPYWVEVMEQVGRVAMATPYDMLFGRKTYDMFASHWPDQSEETNPAAKVMNNARKYVATSSSTPLTWQNSQALTGDIPSEIARLKTEDGPLLQVHGSSNLIQTLLKHDLIDEFRLWTFPVLVGPGKRLFGNESNVPALKLVQSEATTNGVIMTIYRRT